MAKEVVLVEPFCGGSHKYLIEFLKKNLQTEEFEVISVTLPAKKWHWRMLCSAPILAELIPTTSNKPSSKRVLFVAAMTNLAELIGLNPRIRASFDSIVYYFHENQLAYPKVMDSSSNVFNLCYNQIISCKVADKIFFNSKHNLDSYMTHLEPFINKIPTSNRPRIKKDDLIAKSKVLYIPIDVPISCSFNSRSKQTVTIVWPHRWEHDKGKDLFLRVVEQIGETGKKFKLAVLGDQDSSCKQEFASAKLKLQQYGSIEIINWGRIESREEYTELLKSCDIALSTANHEFYGLAMLEAAFSGCFVVAPNALAYPEIFTRENLYNTERQCVKLLLRLISNPSLIEKSVRSVDYFSSLETFTWKSLHPQWKEL